MAEDFDPVEQAGPGDDKGERPRCPDVEPRRVGNRGRAPTTLRQGVAQISGNQPQAVSVSNGEEGAYPRFPFQANHSKALPKLNGEGRSDPNPDAYEFYVDILEEARRGPGRRFDEIPLGGNEDPPSCERGVCDDRMRPRRLTNPQAGLAYSGEGPDPAAVNLNLFRRPPRSMRPAPRIDGKAVSDGFGNQTLAHENTAEMIELYWMALMRDVHFAEYLGSGDPFNPPAGWPTGNLARMAAEDLDRYKECFAEPYPRAGNGTVGPQNIFRGSAPGDNVGPYISQFLLRGHTVRCNRGMTVRHRPEDGIIAEGTVPNLQKQVTVEPFVDFLRDTCSWRCVEQGVDDPSGTDPFECKGNRFIRNLRDLGNWVHIDDTFQHFRNAALLLLNEPPLMAEKDPRAVGLRALDSMGAAGGPMPPFPLDPGNPYSPNRANGRNQMGFVTFGPLHVISLVEQAGWRALLAAWYQKWFVHRRNRPEEFGGLVHYEKPFRDRGETGPYSCIDPMLFGERVLDLIRQRNALTDKLPGDDVPGAETYLLPQLFPEGSPTHPAYPSGHATVSGAAATILKAFFKEDAEMTNPGNQIPTDPSMLPLAFVANRDGSLLEQAAEQEVLTVEGELNKLASNISIGRNAAGVHWRSDATQGMELGEAVAAGLLYEQAFLFEEDHSFTFRRFFRPERVRIERTTSGTTRFVRWTVTRLREDAEGKSVDDTEDEAGDEIVVAEEEITS